MAVVGSTRSTKQQAAMREILYEADGFRTAQELHRLLVEKGDSVGLATVYRTLSRLADAGEIDSIVNADGETQYRRCSDGHHHHLVCVECGNAVEISAKAVERWAQRMASDHGYTDIHHTVELAGRCPDCS